MAGWVRRTESHYANALKWAVNPAVHVVFGGRAAEEKARREATREEIANAAAVVKATYGKKG